MNEEKTEIEIMFSSQFPEEAKKDIQTLLEDKFELSVSKKVIMLKDETVWITIVITFFGTSFTVFLTEFLKESGKLLAQKLFQSGKQAIAKGYQVEHRIEIHNHGQINVIIGKDADETYKQLIDLAPEHKP